MSRFGGLHPMEQSFQEWDREKKLKRNSFWKSLTKAKEEYENTHEKFDVTKFIKWLEEVYGLKAYLLDGNIQANYSIVDEKKYLMYLLKFK